MKKSYYPYIYFGIFWLLYLPIQAQTAQDAFNRWRNQTGSALQNFRAIAFTQSVKLEVTGRQGRDKLETDMYVIKRIGAMQVDRRPLRGTINGVPMGDPDSPMMMEKRYLMHLLRQIPLVFPGMFADMQAGRLLAQESYNGIPSYKIQLIVPEFGTQIQDVFVWLSKEDNHLVASQLFLKPFQGESKATIRERFRMDVIYEHQQGLDMPKYIQSRGLFKREQRNRVFHTEVKHEATCTNYEFRGRN